MASCDLDGDSSEYAERGKALLEVYRPFVEECLLATHIFADMMTLLTRREHLTSGQVFRLSNIV